MVLLPNRRETLQRWVDDGFLLFFLSNQSGIASGKLSQTDAEAAFVAVEEDIAEGDGGADFCVEFFDFDFVA